MLLGYSDSLSKRNLKEVLKGGDSVVLAKIRFLLEELERLEGGRLRRSLKRLFPRIVWFSLFRVLVGRWVI